MTMKLTLLVSLMAASTAVTTFSSPEQIHLSYGDIPNTMIVSWSTPTLNPSNTVQFRSSSDNQTTRTASATTHHFKQLINSSSPLHRCTMCVDEYLHTSLLSQLTPGGTYQYKIDASPSSSTWYNFENVPREVEKLQRPYTLAVYGDMGTAIPGGAVSPSLQHLTKAVVNHEIDAVLHVGDLAYDMKDQGGHTGAEFFRQIQPVAARVPYMTVPGNHEGGTPYTGSLHHYVNRLRMPNYNKGKNSFYSFDVGPVHFVAISSEAYFWQYWQVAQQWAWLQSDLKRVNRTRTPFIVTMAHRPMYCSNSDDHDDCTHVNSTMRRGLFSGKTHEKNGLFALEPLFHKYKVDLCFWAHEHSYERMWPTYEGVVYNGSETHPYTNAMAPVHIVSGAAGCREGTDKYNGPRGPWSAFRNEDYGYGKLMIVNHTHLHWEQLEDQNYTIVDEFWLIKHSK